MTHARLTPRFCFLPALLALIGAAGAGHAQDNPRCGNHPSCVLEALWPGELPEAAHERRGLARAFLTAAEQSRSPELVFAWRTRTGEEPLPPVPDFGLERATRALASLPADSVREAARERREPWFSFGRVDVMVGVWRLSRDPALRAGIVDDLRAMAASANAGDTRRPVEVTDTDVWESREAALALARIGLYACDGDLVREGASLSDSPQALRFLIWEAHTAGLPLPPSALPFPPASAGDNGKDGKKAREEARQLDLEHRRAAAEAYGETWASGSCNG